MSKARTNTYIMYRITSSCGMAQCYINCYPQQRWEYKVEFKADGKLTGKVILSRKGMTLVIPKDDFEKHWKVVVE